MKTKEEKLALLKDTINHFKSNPSSINYASCVYFLNENTGCAIGRLIEDKELCRNFDRRKLNSLRDIFNELPINLQEYGASFLQSLQHLHDDENNWTDFSNGKRELTSEGRVAVKQIVQNENLPVDSPIY